MTRSELLGKIYVLLGGRVAEEMIFGDVSTGAHSVKEKKKSGEVHIEKY